MAEKNPWQLLFVDDEEETCRQVKEFLEAEVITAYDERPQVTTETNFVNALTRLENNRFDLAILDVRTGSDVAAGEDETGVRTLQDIQQRQFVPIVFYTGLPHIVADLESPLIRIVEKTEGVARLVDVIRDVFATRLPAVNRALVRHLAAVQRDYMWGFVSQYWNLFGEEKDGSSLAYLLARRLAMSLAGPGIQQLAEELGGPLQTAIAEGKVHPMQYYIMPPVFPKPLAGDIYRGTISNKEGYWVLLTPSCDVVQGKAEWLILAQCFALTDQTEYTEWNANRSNTKRQQLESLIANNRRSKQPERFHFLPKALGLPDLVVDFQQLVSIPAQQLEPMNRVASLDSPFAEALLARFNRYFGRLGTPDLDIQCIINGLQN